MATLIDHFAGATQPMLPDRATTTLVGCCAVFAVGGVVFATYAGPIRAGLVELVEFAGSNPLQLVAAVG